MTCTEAWTFYNESTLGEVHGRRWSMLQVTDEGEAGEADARRVIL